MRKLIWFALGFSCAAALTAYLFSSIWLYFLGAVILLAAIALYVTTKNLAAKKIALIMLGAAIGFAWFQYFDDVYLDPARQWDQTTKAISIRCTDYSYVTENGIAIDGRVDILNRSYKVRVYLSSSDEFVPGTLLHGEFKFRFTSPGGSREPTYHRGIGIFLMAYPQDEVVAVAPAETSGRYFAAYLRNDLLHKIDRLFPEDVAPFAQALLLGETSNLDYATDTQLSVSGIRHVAAVSGLHVSILFSLVYFVAGKRRYISSILGIPCLLMFAALAGFSASVVRACVMQGLMLLALAFNKEYDAPSALSFAVIAMLFVNPQSITSVGFQLSVASVAGIFLFGARLYGYLISDKRPWMPGKKSFAVRIVRFVAGSVSVSLSAQVFTIPLTAGYFGMVSLVSMLTNLLCLWVVTILFCGIIAVCVFSYIYLPIGAFLANVFAWLARYVLGVSGLLARIPGAAVYTESIYIVAWIVFSYILLALFVLFSYKHPFALFSSVVLSLCVAVLISWSEPLINDYRMVTLDVGQGQCILLQSGGKTYMVDCGGDDDIQAADKAVAALHSQGIFHLDGLILTHMDSDHAGGAYYLLQRMDTDLLILPERVDENDLNLLNQLHDGELVTASDNVQVEWDSAEITVFSSFNQDSGNESSLCVLFHHEKCDILITGDRSKSGEIELLQNNVLPDLDVLVAGHHGSKHSTSEILLEMLRPETAIISVSQYNSYGHPAAEVLQRLQEAGCLVYRTDLNGTIILRG